MKFLQFLIDHQADIAAWITYAMSTLVSGSYAFLGMSKGVRWVARRTAFRGDDGPAERLVAFADSLQKSAAKLARLHARIMPHHSSLASQDAE